LSSKKDRDNYRLLGSKFLKFLTWLLKSTSSRSNLINRRIKLMSLLSSWRILKDILRKENSKVRMQILRPFSPRSKSWKNVSTIRKNLFSKKNWCTKKLPLLQRSSELKL